MKPIVIYFTDRKDEFSVDKRKESCDKIVYSIDERKTDLSNGYYFLDLYPDEQLSFIDFFQFSKS